MYEMYIGIGKESMKPLMTLQEVIELAKEREQWRLSPEGREKHRKDMEEVDRKIREIKE